MKTQPDIAIFIGGTGRSGTSILRDILGKHRDIAAIPKETKLIGSRLFRNFPEMLLQNTKDERKNLLDKFKWLWTNDYFFCFKAAWNIKPGKTKYRGLYTWLEKEDVQGCFSFLDPMAEDIDEHDTYIAYGQFINALFNEYVVKQKKKYWVEKDPSNSRYAHFWYHCFPNLKFINIIRDGRDVACSLGRIEWGTKNQQKAIDQWVKSMVIALEVEEKIPRENYLSVIYEDLVFNKKQVLQKIIDFLGIEWDEDICTVDVFSSSVGRWKKELSDETKIYVQSKYSSFLNYFGYSEDSIA